MKSKNFNNLTKSELIKEIKNLQQRQDRFKLESKISKQFQAIVENSPLAILVFDINLDCFVETNKNAEKLFGLTRQEIFDASPSELSPEFQENGMTSKELTKEKILEAEITGISTFQWNHWNKNKEIIPCEIHLVRMKNKNSNLIFGNIMDMREFKNTRKLLGASEEKYHLIAEQTGQIIYELNYATKQINWAGAIEKLTNYSKEEYRSFAEKEWLNFIHPDDREMTTQLLSEAMTKRILFSAEYRYQKKDKTYINIFDKGIFLYDQFGKAYQMLGTMTDISLTKQWAESLKASEKRFELFSNFTSEAIVIISPKEKKITDTNQAFEKLFNYNKEESLNIYLKELMTIDSWKKIEFQFYSLTSENQIEIFGKKKDNSVFPAILKLNKYKHNKSSKIAISILDVSLTKEAEELKTINKEILLQNEKIERQKIELETAIENLKETQSKLVQSEKMASLGQLIAGIAHEINNPIGAIQASRQNLEDSLQESRSLFLEIASILTEIGSDQASLFVNLIQDGARNHKQLIGMEERKRRKEISSLLKEYNLSEDLRDFLVDIGITDLQLYIPILENKYAKKLLFYATQEIFSIRSIKTIQIAVDRSSKVIFALKNFTHFDTKAAKSLCKLADNIETVLTIYANNLKSVEVIKDYKEVEDIYCYPDDLLHVWTNLLYNALQAMNFIGSLKIEIRKKDNFILVSFTDSGQGIDPEIMSKIFVPFFTTKPPGEGSGLGLDIVNKIIEKHKGKISVDSIPGKTTFTVFLPIIT